MRLLVKQVLKVNLGDLFLYKRLHCALSHWSCIHFLDKIQNPLGDVFSKLTIPLLDLLPQLFNVAFMLLILSLKIFNPLGQAPGLKFRKPLVVCSRELKHLVYKLKIIGAN